MDAYKRLLCNLNAIGTDGDRMVLHASGILTSRMAFLLTFLLRVDLEPRVATSLNIRSVTSSTATTIGQYIPDGGYTMFTRGENCNYASA